MQKEQKKQPFRLIYDNFTALSEKKHRNILQSQNKCLPLHSLSERHRSDSAKDIKSRLRALSSVGSERLPYKQRVGGSNPSAPTQKTHSLQKL